MTFASAFSSRFRSTRTVLLALIVFASLGNGSPSSLANCAGYHGDYMLYWDPNGSCSVPLWSDDGHIYAIEQVGEDVNTGANCVDIEDWLNNHVLKEEWTGHYHNGAYEWAAGSWAVGLTLVHWEYITNTGIWAHEGAHHWLNDFESESSAEWYQFNCPYV